VTHNYLMDRTPFVVGMCADCRRKMWTGTATPPDGVQVSPDPLRCQSCHSWRVRHPGGDPRRAKNTVAEQIRAEWTEDDPHWRRRGNCSDDDEPGIFDPEPDDDERPAGWDRDLFDKTQQYAADAYCSTCPVILICREKAAFHGYEGVWGGASFTRESWTDLIVPGRGGRTIHHRSLRRADRGMPAVSTPEGEPAAA
jgi:hypothetical protein